MISYTERTSVALGNSLGLRKGLWVQIASERKFSQQAMFSSYFSDILLVYYSESFYKCRKKLTNITSSYRSFHHLISQLNFHFSLGTEGRRQWEVSSVFIFFKCFF